MLSDIDENKFSESKCKAKSEKKVMDGTEKNTMRKKQRRLEMTDEEKAKQLKKRRQQYAKKVAM